MSYVYSIVFFPYREHKNCMAIQYSQNISWLQRLLGKADEIAADDPLHEVLRAFGSKFQHSEILSRAEFHALY